MTWIDLAQDRDRWWALVNTVLNLRFLWNVNFLTTSGTVSFWRTVLYMAGYLRLGLPTGLFPSYFLSRTLQEFLGVRSYTCTHYVVALSNVWGRGRQPTPGTAVSSGPRPTPGKEKKRCFSSFCFFLQSGNDLSSYMLAFTQFLLTPYSLTSRHLSQIFSSFFFFAAKIQPHSPRYTWGEMSRFSACSLAKSLECFYLSAFNL